MKKIFIVLALVVIFLIIFIVSSRFTGNSPAKTSEQPGVTIAPYRKEDINKDSKVDGTDSEIIRENLNCNKTQACWTKVIGKTLSGDNPIYSSDLDLNGDGVIDTQDIALVK